MAPYVPGLTESMRAEMQRELDAQLSSHNLKRQDKWVYHTAAWLDANDPSLKDGLDPVKLKLWRRQVCRVISAAGMSLNIPQWGIAAASLLCHRFFARKSMKKNDRYLIATACLHLAAKMEESPKPIREVARECLKITLGKASDRFRRATEPDVLERYKDEVLVAERAVLYTIGFNLNVEHPYRSMVRHLTALGHLQPHMHSLMQSTWDFLNDSFRSTLCLQYAPEVMCAGALWTAAKIKNMMADLMQVVENMAMNQGCSVTFYSHFKITVEQAEAIGKELLSIYPDVPMSKVSHIATPTHQAFSPDVRE